MYAPQHVNNNKLCILIAGMTKHLLCVGRISAMCIHVCVGSKCACKYAHTKHVQSICCVVIICYTPLLCAYLHAHLLPTHT